MKPTPPHSPPAANTIQSILEWLAEANQSIRPESTDELHRKIRQLRAAPIPSPQRVKLLDLFFTLTERLICAELPDLLQTTMPIPRRLQLQARGLQALLQTLSQDYLNTLSELFDPQLRQPHRPPNEALRRSLQCVVWNIQISQLVAAPTPAGLWLELHNTFNTIRQLGLNATLSADENNELHRLYLRAILIAIAQPASFNAHELDFINNCLDSIGHNIAFSEAPPADSKGAFWIDPNTDFPAHALARRRPPPDTTVCFFSCKSLAEEISKRLKAVEKGSSSAHAGLPAMADEPTGQAVLHRLITRWGNPGKRRFNRRRQSYRAKLTVGLNHLWQLFRTPESPPLFSEWMVINESPDGYAIMHMSGEADSLEVGDIVAIQPSKESSQGETAWHLCLVRWAISENPEHIELGLQLLAPSAMAAMIAQPLDSPSGTNKALLIPAFPPLRNTAALIIENGQLNSQSGKIIALLEKENLEIREFRPAGIDEQTNRIEVFSVEPDETR